MLTQLFISERKVFVFICLALRLGVPDIVSMQASMSGHLCPSVSFVRLCVCLTQVYRSELLKEQLREIEVLPLDPREQRLQAAKTMQEQVNQKILQRSSVSLCKNLNILKNLCRDQVYFEDNMVGHGFSGWVGGCTRRVAGPPLKICFLQPIFSLCWS